MCQLSCPKVIIIHGSLRWLKICFSDVRASFQLECFTFIRMGGDPVKITASKGALKRGGSKRATSIFIVD
jgi:hypothetical protein